MLWRILLNLRADRHCPPLQSLAAERVPERFVWRILPHAARTFSFCIVFMPGRMVLALAVAYLYCRILDTFEDMVPGVENKVAALERFSARFDAPAEAMPPPDELEDDWAEDDRDRAHQLLVRRTALVDQVFARLSPAQQGVIRRLVRRMGRGMVWSTRVFAAQGGTLRSPGQVAEYCWHVLGTTMLFADEMQRMDFGLEPQPEMPRVRTCARAGESIQLANITRDVSKDQVRGIHYHPVLQDPDAGTAEERAQEARVQLLRRALRLGGALRGLVEGMPFRRVSRARGAALLLVLTTFAYYQKATERIGLDAWNSRQRLGRARGAWWYLRSVLSDRFATGVLIRVEESFAQASRRASGDDSDEFAREDGDFDVASVLDATPVVRSLATSR